MIFLPFIFYIVIGLLAGLLAGLCGVGGGLVVIPLLFFTFSFFDFFTQDTMQMTIGTSLAAMVFTTGSSAWAHYLKGGIQWKIAAFLLPGIISGIFIGAFIDSFITSKNLELIFAIFVAILGIIFLIPPRFEQIEKTYSAHFLILIIIGLIIGSISSMFGIGGGSMTVPILKTLKVSLKNAISTSSFTCFIVAVVGAISFLFFGWHQHQVAGSLGYIHIPAFITIGIVTSLTAPIGANWTYCLHPNKLRSIYGLYLIIVGITMVSNSI